MHHLLGAFLALALSAAGWAQPSPLLGILSQELDRNFQALKQKADPPPYFLAYAVTESEVRVLTASRGALIADDSARDRYLDLTLRVGSPQLDNYHRLPGEMPQFTSGARLSLDDNAAAIQNRLWLETDRVYRLAGQRLTTLKTSTQIKASPSDRSDDFSREEPSVYAEKPEDLKFQAAEWVARMRKLSAAFDGFPAVLSGSITLLAQRETKWLATSEGARIQHGHGLARLVIRAQGKAPDGMTLETTDSFEAGDAARLPKDAAIAAAVARVAAELTGQTRASLVEPFVGPAILSGRAAGVFFHEIFGHRIEGHRQKDEAEGQTFTQKVGQPVLPEFLSVIFDPTRRSAEGVDLNGSYLYDDEGVKARPVTVVEQGTLKTFLMSRSPIQGFDHSNGHGRRRPGSEVVSRQSNLFVESARTVPEAKLREMLRDEIRRQGKPYGYYFKEVTGGFTTTQRRGVQAFKVIPLVVYRVYPDGRPDDLVRGADIVGTPLASFAKILATSDQREVFNGYCGAESGSVPVSAVSPALLVSEIEIQKKEASRDRPPLLPSPSAAGAGR
ncbi:MAG: peptidase U62 [Acidobacteria bacterium]|nr:peptidase U62 [Acidobacteriota bacterium]